MHKRFLAPIALLGMGFLPCGTGQAAPVLQAYALSAGGMSAFGSQGPFSCATFARDPMAQGVGMGFEVGLPTQSGCGVGVDSRTASAASGTVTVASTLGVSFGLPADPRVFLGSSTGRAGFGNLGVSANASYGGSTDSSVVSGSQAFGLQTEPMTFGGATGTGFYQPTFTIDGSLFNVGRTDNELAFSYGVGTGPHYLAFRILNARGAISFYGPNGYETSFPGFSVTGSPGTGYTVAGSTTFTLNIPIMFGTATDITYALWAASLPSSNAGLLTASTGDVEFLNTVRLTGIEVRDSRFFPVDAFTIASGSGTVYNRNGVVAATQPGGPNGVPEPGTLPLASLALLAAGWIRNRGRSLG
jgi:hypothetical protein